METRTIELQRDSKDESIELLQVSTTPSRIASPESDKCQSDSDEGPGEAETSPNVTALPPLDKGAVWSLVMQHFSSTWVARSFEFAIFLFLITMFPGTLLPASIYGFCTTGAAVIFSGSVGTLVGSNRRLPFIRLNIIVQKSLSALVYAIFLILFVEFPGVQSGALLWSLFTIVTALSGLLKLSTIGMTVSIERDWVTVIAEQDSDRLNQLNTWLRRVDLISALVAPLFVSLLTTVETYAFTAAFFLGFSVATMAIEWFWINVVYNRFTVLEEEQMTRRAKDAAIEQLLKSLSPPHHFNWQHFLYHIRLTSNTAYTDWHDFITSPVFPSSLAISLLFFTVLSFDGVLLSYLLTHNWSNAFLSGMRGLSVIAGLAGTVVMPMAEKRIGLIRTGSWSIISQLICLAPVTLSFFINPAPVGEQGAVWNAVVLFSFLSLSRVGLWCFDLVQLKQLQIILNDHPRRNTLTALQFSLQNMFDLLRSVLTIILSSPAQFRYAAAVSFGAVFLAVLSYSYYVKKQRGHVLMHVSWEKLIKKKI